MPLQIVSTRVMRMEQVTMDSFLWEHIPSVDVTSGGKEMPTALKSEEELAKFTVTPQLCQRGWGFLGWTRRQALTSIHPHPHAG